VLVRTAADAFDSVEPDVRQSATAMGFSSAGRFWGVDLPLAGPVLVSGLRVVIVSTVSLATVGAVIGVQSLGSLFTDGFQRGIQAEIFTGIVATIVLALALDWACVRIGPPAHAVVASRRGGAAAVGRAGRAGGCRVNLFLDGIAWILDPANWTGVGSIPERIGQHLLISAIVLVIASVIALPAGVAVGHSGAARSRR
jgi:ABC-type proline/glycine betaine transport system permease subunit